MNIIDTLVDGYRDSLSAVPYGDGQLVSLSTTFASGDLLTVHVTVVDGTAFVTDRGLTADQLTDAGVAIDFDSRSAASRSFAAVRDSVGLPLALGSEPWEISATADLGNVNIAVQAVADAAMRADGLRALQRSHRIATFADQSVRRLSARAAVVPKAKMPGRYGQDRQVTLSYKGKDDSPFYLQALSGRDTESRNRAYDHASGLFLGAQPQISHRLALLQKGNWSTWQRRNLSEVCRVIEEDEVDEFIDSTAAVAA